MNGVRNYAKLHARENTNNYRYFQKNVLRMCTYIISISERKEEYHETRDANSMVQWLYAI